MSIGLDFGTTNSAIARACDGEVKLARFALNEARLDTFRSVLYFPSPEGTRELRSMAGPGAIEAYLAASGAGRLLQSMKSYLADAGFQSTSVHGRAMTLPQLLARLLESLREQAERDLGPLGRSLVVGRPVHFAHARGEGDAALAQQRLEGALATAGFDQVTFVQEPVAAAYYYEQRLDHDELVLVGDFGGGTSDFTLTRVGPSRRRGGQEAVIATEGVALAGDALGGRIVEQVVAPALGMNTTYRPALSGATEVPRWPYERLRRWHHLALLKSREVTEMLRSIERTSSDPERIAAFREVIDDDLGFSLYQAVERAKIDLSMGPSARFHFECASLTVEQTILREEFEAWIARELAEIEAAIDRLLQTSGVAPGDVDRVFLTGGTSLVPAVRRIFERRFGPGAIAAGGELVSVASGLAMIAAEREASPIT
ncbi:MAG: Hsp70 family protein [Polyangiaceae bacterium]|jgi:hypothetical chaperone protein|nr:Hsp70 family protein [Polyangiaceae bacterium]